MKRLHKITFASLAVVLGVLSGVLTIVEKSINIVNSLKVKTEASEIPKNEKVVKGYAGRVTKNETKMTAKESIKQQ